MLTRGNNDFARPVAVPGSRFDKVSDSSGVSARPANASNVLTSDKSPVSTSAGRNVNNCSHKDGRFFCTFLNLRLHVNTKQIHNYKEIQYLLGKYKELM